MIHEEMVDYLYRLVGPWYKTRGKIFLWLIMRVLFEFIFMGLKFFKAK